MSHRPPEAEPTADQEKSLLTCFTCGLLPIYVLVTYVANPDLAQTFHTTREAMAFIEIAVTALIAQGLKEKRREIDERYASENKPINQENAPVPQTKVRLALAYLASFLPMTRS